MNQIDLIEDFIFNDEVQEVISKINDNLMDFNILEITGMGTQEIKHSNILSWLFSDSEHGLEYSILDRFLYKMGDMELKHYLYLPKKERQLTIFREKNNIDLLIVDSSNEIVIIIENKVYSTENGNQLEEYENKIEEEYKEFKKYFIYLTIDLEESSRPDIWLRADYQMITDSIIEILNSGKEISTKSKIIIESYIDLLKRMGLVSDNNLKELCEKIWSNKEYRNALNILIDNKPSNKEKISKFILNRLDQMEIYHELYNEKPNDIVFRTESIDKNLYKEDKLYYSIYFDDYDLSLAIYIDKEDSSLDELYKSLFSKKSRSRRNQLYIFNNEDWNEYIQDIGNENLEEKISKILESLLDELNKFDKKLEEKLEKTNG